MKKNKIKDIKKEESLKLRFKDLCIFHNMFKVTYLKQTKILKRKGRGYEKKAHMSYSKS